MRWNGAKSEFPYTFSVGAVVLNDQGQILCHHFERYAELDDFYVLMRETVEENEAIEAALARGLREEFGVTAQILGLLGSLEVKVPYREMGKVVRKTTLYFKCQLTDISEVDRSADKEGASQLVWMDPNVLISKIEAQADRFPEQEDIHEAEIVRRAISV